METKNKKHRNKGMIKSQKGKNYATFMRLYHVNNCTIPSAKKEDLVEVEMYGHKFFACKHVTSDGNGKIGSAHKWIEEIRPKKKQRTNKTDPYYTTKRPWYIATAKDFKHSTKEETVESLLESRAMAKMLKWDRKNPVPKLPKVENNDMFKNDENIMKDHEDACKKHKEARQIAFEKAKEYAKKLYEKGILYGRFMLADSKYTEANGEAYPVRLSIVKGSEKEQKAQKETNKLRKKHQNLVATKLKTETGEKIFMPKNDKGIVLPELKKAA